MITTANAFSPTVRPRAITAASVTAALANCAAANQRIEATVERAADGRPDRRTVAAGIAQPTTTAAVDAGGFSNPASTRYRSAASSAKTTAAARKTWTIRERSVDSRRVAAPAAAIGSPVLAIVAASTASDEITAHRPRAVTPSCRAIRMLARPERQTPPTAPRVPNAASECNAEPGPWGSRGRGGGA